MDTVNQRLETEKASWTVPNLVQVTWQVMERDPHRSAEQDQARAERCVAAVLAHPDVLKLTPSLGLDLPAELVRADGEAVYQVHNEPPPVGRTPPRGWRRMLAWDLVVRGSGGIRRSSGVTRWRCGVSRVSRSLNGPRAGCKRHEPGVVDQKE